MLVRTLHTIQLCQYKNVWWNHLSYILTYYILQDHELLRAKVL